MTTVLTKKYLYTPYDKEGYTGKFEELTKQESEYRKTYEVIHWDNEAEAKRGKEYYGVINSIQERHAELYMEYLTYLAEQAKPDGMESALAKRLFFYIEKEYITAPMTTKVERFKELCNVVKG